MFEQILVVCVGNICRSPMAEVLLAHRLRSMGLCVTSAGLRALVGHTADPLAIELLRDRGFDLSFHRARQLTRDLLLQNDLVLVMDSEQQHAVESLLPAARGRVHRIGRWGHFDVPDPYRRGRAAFEEALGLLERAVADFHRVIMSVTSKGTWRKATG